MRIIPFLFLITLFSCARKTVVRPVSAPADKNTRVSLKTLSVVKTQEMLGDELVLVGALGIIENGKVRSVQVFSSYVGKVKKGQIIRLDTIKALEIRLRSGQKASFQMALFEIEDYQPTKKWVNKVLVGEREIADISLIQLQYDTSNLLSCAFQQFHAHQPEPYSGSFLRFCQTSIFVPLFCRRTEKRLYPCVNRNTSFHNDAHRRNDPA